MVNTISQARISFHCAVHGSIFVNPGCLFLFLHAIFNGPRAGVDTFELLPSGLPIC